MEGLKIEEGLIEQYVHCACCDNGMSRQIYASRFGNIIYGFPKLVFHNSQMGDYDYITVHNGSYNFWDGYSMLTKDINIINELLNILARHGYDKEKIERVVLYNHVPCKYRTWNYYKPHKNTITIVQEKTK